MKHIVVMALAVLGLSLGEGLGAEPGMPGQEPPRMPESRIDPGIQVDPGPTRACRPEPSNTARQGKGRAPATRRPSGVRGRGRQRAGHPVAEIIETAILRMYAGPTEMDGVKNG